MTRRPLVEDTATLVAVLAAATALLTTPGDLPTRAAYATLAALAGGIAGWMIGTVIVWWRRH